LKRTHIGLVFNLKPEAAAEEDEPPDRYAEYDSPRTICAVADALTGAGYAVTRLEADEELYPRLRRLRPDLVFNLAEGLRGESRESHVPAILEMLGIPYTGSGPLTLALALDKPMAKRVWAAEGVPVPRGQTFYPGDPIVLRRSLRFPLFVKPAREGSSMGVTPASVVRDKRELVAQVEWLHASYGGPALVEEFLPGREFTVGVLGNRDYHVFPILEVLFDRVPDPEHGAVYSYRFKQEWDTWDYFACPADIPAELAGRLERLAIAAYRAIRCYDVGRVDIRLDAAGNPYVLEINPLPGLCPGYSDLPRMAQVGGVAYEDLVLWIVDAALERHGLLSARLARQTA